MIKFENTQVVGWEHAIRGMRNPMNSWGRSDSSHCNWCQENDLNPGFCDESPVVLDDGSCYLVGTNDLDLMKRLRNAGTDHRKFMRMIVVYVDITAPLYWWKEFDTYKVGTVANSCSTMHKIAAKEFTLEDFSCEHLMSIEDPDDEDVVRVEGRYGCWDPEDILVQTIYTLNFYRQKYLETKSKPMKNEQARKELMKKYWWQMIQLHSELITTPVKECNEASHVTIMSPEDIEKFRTKGGYKLTKEDLEYIKRKVEEEKI